MLRKYIPLVACLAAYPGLEVTPLNATTKIDADTAMPPGFFKLELPMACTEDTARFEAGMAAAKARPQLQGAVPELGRAMVQVYQAEDGQYGIVLRVFRESNSLVSCLILEGPRLTRPDN